MQDINAMQTQLSLPDAFTDCDLENELELLLSTDNEEALMVPTNSNSMGNSAAPQLDDNVQATALESARLTPVLECKESIAVGVDA